MMMASVILKAVTKDILKKLLARIEGKHLENANKIKYMLGKMNKIFQNVKIVSFKQYGIKV